MATVPVPRTWSNGEFVTDTIMNGSTGIRDALSFLLNPPRAAVRQTVAQSIPSATYTALTFTTEDFDNDVIHDTVTNNTRLTCKTAGTYQLTGKVAFATSSVGRRGARWALNGTAIAGGELITPANPTGGCEVAARTIYVAMVVGDFVELQGFQDTAGALNTVVSGVETQSAADARWIGT